jgi:Zn-dependent membrane protease YugP
MFYWWNPTYWLFVAPALLLMFFAQWRVRSAYNKWGKVANRSNLRGAQVAERLLTNNRMSNVSIRPIAGELSDNYDPRSRTLNLSQGTGGRDSVAAMAIVAHEVGHAQQHAQGNLLLQMRSGLVPAVNLGAQFGPILFIVGYFLRFTPLMWVGIAFFSLAFVFALITLPVEIDASMRAMRMLKSSGIMVTDDERRGARAVLSAAALTYVAAMLMALVQLLYYVMLAGSGRRRR